MIPIRDLFETHLTVSDLGRSMKFFGDVLGLEVAHVVSERRVAFYWIGGRGESMLGIWEVGSGPQRLSLHTAFKVDLADLLEAPAQLHAANVTPRDFSGKTDPGRAGSAGLDASPLRFTSTTRTGTCSNFSPCCRSARSRNWELSAGVSGHEGKSSGARGENGNGETNRGVHFGGRRKLAHGAR